MKLYRYNYELFTICLFTTIIYLLLLNYATFTIHQSEIVVKKMLGFTIEANNIIR